MFQDILIQINLTDAILRSRSKKGVFKMMLNYILGLAAIIFGVYQAYNSVKYVKILQHNGNKTTSNFSAIAVWYSLAFGIGFLVLGICLFFVIGPVN
ncbi:hypothetical protein LNA01_19170 [Companilactobacillus nantensis]|uniref:Uncharacterized protein n=2 Tax=Companilactobacillus nantensis TaxID=305793 RepID=A0A0R1WR22_9LACO|nr:hypothetical protein FD31_GL002575 [Companilactobacillus nantensis DSM 16982]GEO64734.1 hypothetical protein LNA01_19170 [Companilactobacillus nantensis]